MKHFFSFIALLFLLTAVLAQPKSATGNHLPSLPALLNAKENTGSTPMFTIDISPKNQCLGSILIDPSATILLSNAKAWISNQLHLRPGVDELVNKNYPVISQSQEIAIDKYQQFYKGIKVENGTVNAAGKNGRLGLMQLEFYSIPDNFIVTPSLNADAALQKAMKYMMAKKYVWEGYTGNGPNMQKPIGELLIVTDELAGNNEPCLAYKFLLKGSQPAVNAYVYVNAVKGNIVLVENSMKFCAGKEKESDLNVSTKQTNFFLEPNKNAAKKLIANVTGTADTRYNGTRNITTDQTSSVLFPFRLRQTTAYGVPVEVYNYQKRIYNDPNTLLAVDFSDNDNNWSAAEYGTPAVPGDIADNAGIQVYFNLGVVADYWKDKQQRNSWNNQAGAAGLLKGYVHISDPEHSTPKVYDNAGWDFTNHQMVYGDGADGAYTSFDITAHEVGHGVTQNIMSSFSTGREPGALEEGFSDIWAACAIHYANTNPNINYNGMGDVWKRGGLTQNGDRQMDNPKNSECPDTYYGHHFVEASLSGCPANDKNSDYCGVHTNSTILSKWFYLITNGGTGTNDNGYTYTVTGSGFDITEKIAFFTEALLSKNTDFRAVMNASLNYVKFTYPGNANLLAQVQEAWKAVGLLNFTTYNKDNTPIFKDNTNNTTFLFNALAVGKDGHVWAGTSGKGLFKFNGNIWELSPTTLDNKVNVLGMNTDLNGGVWMAQAGYSITGSSATNNSGGVYFFDDTLFTSKRYYNTSNNLPSLNARSIFIDKTVTGNLPKVWVASMSHTNSASSSSTFTPGGIGKGIFFLSDISPLAFFKYRDGIDDNSTSGTGGIGGVQTIGGDNSEVWAYSSTNTTPEIIRYDATGTYLGKYNSSNVTQLFPGFNAKAIYFDVNGNKWIGLGNNGVGTNGEQLNGIVVKTASGLWFNNSQFSTSLVPPGSAASFPELFPAGTIVNNNAITGDDAGKVYIGTTNGLVIYDATNNLISKPEYYKRYTTNEGLPFNNIKSIAVDTLRRGLWLASGDNNGIAFWAGMERAVSVYSVKTQCPGDLISYKYYLRGKFNSTPVPNKVIVELSDDAGSFTSPTVLEEILDYRNTTERHRISVPVSTTTGFGYRIRARTTNPAMMGDTSGVFTIIRRPILNLPGAHPLIAQRECTDGLGWTHYFNKGLNLTDEADDILLLSMKVGENVADNNYIGHIGDPGFSVMVASTVKAGTNSADQVNNPLITNRYISMNRYWNVTPLPLHQPTSPVSVRFYYNTQDLADINGSVPYATIDHHSLVFTKVLGTASNSSDPSAGFPGATSIISYRNLNDGSLTPLLGANPTWIYTQLTPTIHQAEFLVDHFSGGTGGSTADNGPLYNPVPIQLLSFNAQISNGKTLLQWKTSTEINTDHFEVERSADGRNFNTVIGSTQAAGNSSAEKNYTVTDALPLNGKNYYRLKTTDRDGKISYSQIVLIKFGSRAQLITIYPNPVKKGESLQLSLENFSVSKIEIINTVGQLVYSKISTITGTTSIRLPASLAAGQYMLRVVGESKIFTEKILVQ